MVATPNLTPTLKKRLFEFLHFLAKESNRIDLFGNRVLEIKQLTIAQALNISEKTVRNYISLCIKYRLLGSFKLHKSKKGYRHNHTLSYRLRTWVFPKVFKELFDTLKNASLPTLKKKLTESLIYSFLKGGKNKKKFVWDKERRLSGAGNILKIYNNEVLLFFSLPKICCLGKEGWRILNWAWHHLFQKSREIVQCFFRKVLESKWLMGQKTRKFVPSLLWLLRKEVFSKVIMGIFDDEKVTKAAQTVASVKEMFEKGLLTLEDLAKNLIDSEEPELIRGREETHYNRFKRQLSDNNLKLISNGDIVLDENSDLICESEKKCNDLKLRLLDKLGGNEYASWISPIDIKRDEKENCFILVCPHKINKEYLTGNANFGNTWAVSSQIKQVLKEMNENKIRIVTKEEWVK